MSDPQEDVIAFANCDPLQRRPGPGIAAAMSPKLLQICSDLSFHSLDPKSILAVDRIVERMTLVFELVILAHSMFPRKSERC
jgi:hypothetical protein